jgi:hypothetical protein
MVRGPQPMAARVTDGPPVAQFVVGALIMIKSEERVLSAYQSVCE